MLTSKAVTMTSPAPAWFVSFKSTPVDVFACQICWS